MQIAASRKDLQRSVVFNPSLRDRDPHDELFLAYRFLNMIGVDGSHFEKTYRISSTTLAKLNKGEVPLTKNREQLFQIFMYELDLCYEQTQAELISLVMLEASRRHANLSKNEAIWQLIEKSDNSGFSSRP